MVDQHQLTTDLIRRDFELEGVPDQLSEEELLRLLIDHVDFLIDRRMEWLLSLMYRMDIDEEKVNAALHPAAPEPANIGLAKLILARQQARVRTKVAYPPEDLGEEWEW